jgi:hypothetical protein
MNKWPRCEDCVRDNYLRAPVCQTCVAGSNFCPGDAARFTTSLSRR